MTRTTPLKWFGAAALTLTLLASTSACSDPASGDSGGDKKTVSIVGFSILKTANKTLVSDFQKTDEGKGGVGRVTLCPDGRRAGMTFRAEAATNIGRDIDQADLPQPRAIVYDVATGKPILTMICPHGYCGPVAFSPDGSTLAVASSGGVHLFDLSEK